ncbi:MAG: molybdopterin-dependent oxidoreductase [Rubritepida sp.]|nr:molybdopterin-dependent oxidoreductase [Rubritepida sp.]
MIALTVNGAPHAVAEPPHARLSTVLRDSLGLTGTKVGCDAGDCGACTVLIDGAQACACMVALGQLEGAAITTIEGFSGTVWGRALSASFLHHGAAQCGICTPGMVMAAAGLLAHTPAPDGAAGGGALGGGVGRCTGYRAITDAVLAAHRYRHASPADMPDGVGARLPRLDGPGKLDGSTQFGADAAPADALWLRAIRSPHPHARFTLGAAPPGVTLLTAADVPGRNGFGIYPHIKDQPVFCADTVLYRGDCVAALVGARDAVEAAVLEVEWEVLAPLDMAAALAPGAPLLHPHLPGNILTTGRVVSGTPAPAAHQAEIAIQTSFVEHAYLEPEAGYARRVGDTIEVFASTQAPYMDREEVAAVLGIAPEAVRIIPSACGGGFGGKLDVSLQPMLAVAAWRLERPVRAVYSRGESMVSSTKRHPAHIAARAGCDADGHLTHLEFDGDYDTGAYASWGPTVAGRVPVHASGPYRVPAVRAVARAVHSHNPPSGAFRGFGVPQAAIAQEALWDMLADQAGLDRLEFRWRNALRVGDRTACGQLLEHSVGLAACLDALRPHWRVLRAQAAAASGPLRHGVGIACMWYGIGNTGMSNPSTMRLTLAPDGRITFFNGAVDIGQGSSTVLPQIAAEALGLRVVDLVHVNGDSALTPDAGKTSASRQTFVSGRAAMEAGLALRAAILRRANAGPEARLVLAGGVLRVDGVALRLTEPLHGEGSFDPPTVALDAHGQGIPYACYGFAAQVVALAVDPKLGTVHLHKIVAAHDVGRAINPTLVEGQIHGGIAQGIGLALMEEYIPGRTENLHDYLIPSMGDVPPIETILIEDPEPLGPYGAKGVGEPALVATAPAIFSAIRDATGAVITRVPARPDRVLEAMARV